MQEVDVYNIRSMYNLSQTLEAEANSRSVQLLEMRMHVAPSRPERITSRLEKNM